MINLLTFTVNRGIIVNVKSNSPNGAEKENNMKYNRTITKASEIISVALVGAGIAADGWTMQIISAAPVGADADRYTVAVYQPRRRIPSTVWALTIDTAHDGWTIAARTMECIYNRDTMGADIAPRHALTSAITGRIRITAPAAVTETTETTETAPAAEPETETAERAAEINPMCTDCIRRGSDCDGTTCETWTGCIYRETAAQRDIRLFDFYKRRLLALAGGEPLRWVCVQYLCSFPGLSPYDMGAELMAEGVEIIYDDTAITRAENAAERRRVQRAYAAREGVKA